MSALVVAPGSPSLRPRSHRRASFRASALSRTLGQRSRRAALALAPLLVVHVLWCGVLAWRERRRRWAPEVMGAGIPKIIHQMYKERTLPPQWAGVPDAWATTQAPTAADADGEGEQAEAGGGYTYRLWTDAELRSLIETEYPWLLPTYDGYPHATQRWDASRYAVLHKFGGLYADLDISPIARIDGLLRGQSLLLPHTPNLGLTNALMAATPGHPFFDFVLHKLPRCAPVTPQHPHAPACTRMHPSHAHTNPPARPTRRAATPPRGTT